MLSDQELSDRVRADLQSELRMLNPPDDLVGRLRAKAKTGQPQRDPATKGFPWHWLRLRSRELPGCGAPAALIVAWLAVG